MKKKNIIKTGLLKSINEDQHTCEVSYLGKDYEAVFFSPFGLYSYPDTKIPCLILQINGDEDNLVAIPYDPDNRPTLEKGDAGLKTSNGKMSVLLHKDGTVEIKGASEDWVKLVGELGDYAQDIITKLSTTTVATALGASILSTQPEFLLMLNNPAGNIVQLLAKIHNFEA